MFNFHLEEKNTMTIAQTVQKKKRRGHLEAGFMKLVLPWYLKPKKTTTKITETHRPIRK